MRRRFSDDFETVILDWVARARRSAAGSANLDYEVLSEPRLDSPFLTLAERLEGVRANLPWRVLKLLLVLDDDPSQPFWREVLEREERRWRQELARHLDLPNRVDRLGLPLSPSRSGVDDLVTTGEIGPIRHRDVLDDAPADGSARFYFLVRPYIAWPRLCDVGYSADQLKEWWAIYCRDHDVEDHLRELLFDHFCHEALTNGSGDLLLTSAWRLEP
jgi:hypothetical protein